VTSQPSHNEELLELLKGFEEAPPELIARRKLLRRTDSKFLVKENALFEILSRLHDHYQILLANGEALACYETLYFDTEDLRCFHDHRRGVRPRHKVRVRHYRDRNVTFLEIKTKRSEFITNKQRKQQLDHSVELKAEDLEFIAASCGVPADKLRAQLWTNFHRITLIGKNTNERITIDTGLNLVAGERAENLLGVAIMEVKQSPFSMCTPAMVALRETGHRPASASKYCTASMLLRDNLRCNRLLPGLRQIEGMRNC